jgi:hypothetical protein
VFVKSPSLILLFDHSHFQGCFFHTVFCFPLPSPNISSFFSFLYPSFLFLSFHFPSVF